MKPKIIAVMLSQSDNALALEMAPKGNDVVAAAPGSAEYAAALKDTDYLAGALCLPWGGVAYYQFGGTTRTSLGAGTYLQWEVMKHYRELGFSRYVLGQVASGPTPAEAKFAVGISPFKRRFGATELPSASRGYVLRPWRHAIWRTLGRFRRSAEEMRSWTTPE